MYIKKVVQYLVIVCILAGIAGCGKEVGTKNEINIICTTYPAYDWTRELIGGTSEKVHVQLLQSPGGDIHNFQPTTEDMANISKCDLFIYNGGTSDSWVTALLESMDKPIRTIAFMEEVEQILYYNEADDSHEGHDHDTHDSHEQEADEHVWLSLVQANRLCNTIKEELIYLDKENEKVYEQYADSYTEKLQKLDKQYEEMVQQTRLKTVLFADRFPFRYLLEDYQIAYYAAFPGCSAESEASFQTITSLTAVLEEEQLPAVLTVEGSNQGVAKTIVDSTKEKNQKILAMNALQTVTVEEKSYLEIMEENWLVLKEALGGI